MLHIYVQMSLIGSNVRPLEVKDLLLTSMLNRISKSGGDMKDSGGAMSIVDRYHVINVSECQLEIHAKGSFFSRKTFGINYV